MDLKVEGMGINGDEKVEEVKELNYRGVKAMPYVIGNETFEKLGTIGTSTNLLVYLTTVFNMKSITATNLINIFSGTCNFGTLGGAFLSDTYFGRYKVLGTASISSFLGMLVLTLTAAVTKLHPHKCVDTLCEGPTAWQMTFLLSGFVFLIIGASGIRPCNLAFGADQFNPNTESGQRGIASFFNWYYFTFTFAMMVSLTVIVYVQANINWAIGLGIPTFLMFLSCAVFFIGTKIYVLVPPEGSPLTSIFQVLVATIKKRKLDLEEPSVSLLDHVSTKSINLKLPYTNQLRVLNKAAIITPNDKMNPDGSSGNRWTLCSIQQIEEVKCVIKTVPVWLSCIIYNVSINQMQTYTVFQALQSDRRLKPSSFEVPAASYTVFQMLALTIWIPIYDQIIVPCLRRITNKRQGISLLQRIGVGMGIAIFTMLVAAIVETKRRDLAHSQPTIGFEKGKGAISSMSGYWLIFQLMVAGLSEGFAVIGFVEFFYKQFPENMKSFAGSFLFCGMAMSSYLSSFLISIVHRTTRDGVSRNWLAQDLNEAKLDYFYYLCTGLEVLNFIYYLIVAKWYKYKGTGDELADVPLEDMTTHKHVV
ncbi:putative proton-dependent oligopeptide transporter family, major facilitator superfamily [Helianthus annuus]|nr:putative proton-dependent oligopeptide transporter family, MFS transporter superfamily [Helianthus annuus]KAJ0819760.1 putative proton-dependent oligopeptide transporter family, major facilitator superfamily [Helianthus annuus]